MIRIHNRLGSNESWIADLFEGEELLFRLTVTDNRRQISIAELFPEDPNNAHYSFIRVEMPLSDQQIRKYAINTLEALYWRSKASWVQRRIFKLPKIL